MDRSDLRYFVPPVAFGLIAWALINIPTIGTAGILFIVGWVVLGILASFVWWCWPILAKLWKQLWEPEKPDAAGDQTAKLAVGWGVALLLLVVGLWLTVGLAPYLTMKSEGSSNAFGDSYGFLNVGFSGLAFAGVILAIILQTMELRLQRKEIDDSQEIWSRTVEEQQKTTDIQKQTSKTLLMANYLSLLNNHREAFIDRNKSLESRSVYFQVQFWLEYFKKELADHDLPTVPDYDWKQWVLSMAVELHARETIRMETLSWSTEKERYENWVAMLDNIRNDIAEKSEVCPPFRMLIAEDADIYLQDARGSVAEIHHIMSTHIPSETDYAAASRTLSSSIRMLLTMIGNRIDDIKKGRRQ